MKLAKNVLPERDPRSDPQPDDKLMLADYSYRVVMKRYERTVVYLSTIAGVRRCTLKAWTNWCRKNNAQVQQ